jgi:hypothetical protein
MLAMTLSGSISRKQQVRMVIEAVLQRATLFEHCAAASLQSIIGASRGRLIPQTHHDSAFSKTRTGHYC